MSDWNLSLLGRLKVKGPSSCHMLCQFPGKKIHVLQTLFVANEVFYKGPGQRLGTQLKRRSWPWPPEMDKIMLPTDFFIP